MSGRVYVGHLSSRIRERDIEDMFSKFGRINRVDLKNGYGFIEFDDERDADDAVREMDGRPADGQRIIVEIARGGRDRGDRDRGRGGRSSSDRCFNCGKGGHWARDCPDEGGRDKCFNCGRNGHPARECPDKRGARSQRHHPYSRSSRRSRSRSRSLSRSRSPRRSLSPRGKRSPSPRRRSPSPNNRANSRSRSRSPQ